MARLLSFYNLEYLEVEIEDGYCYYELPIRPEEHTLELEPACTLWLIEMEDLLEVSFTPKNDVASFGIYYGPEDKLWYIALDGHLASTLTAKEETFEILLELVLNTHLPHELKPVLIERIKSYLPTIKKNCEEHDAHQYPVQ